MPGNGLIQQPRHSIPLWSHQPRNAGWRACGASTMFFPDAARAVLCHHLLKVDALFDIEMWHSFPRTTVAILILPWTCFKERKSQRSILYSPATQWEPKWPLPKTFHEDYFHNYKVTAPRSLETEDFFSSMPFFFKCIDRLAERYKGRELNLDMKKVLPKSIGQEFLHKQSEATHGTAV